MQRILTDRIKELKDVSLDVMDSKLNYSSTLHYLELTFPVYVVQSNSKLHEGSGFFTTLSGKSKQNLKLQATKKRITSCKYVANMNFTSLCTKCKCGDDQICSFLCKFGHRYLCNDCKALRISWQIWANSIFYRSFVGS